MSAGPQGYRVRVRGEMVGVCTTLDRAQGPLRVGRLMLHGPALRKALGPDAPMGQKDLLNYLTTGLVFDVLDGESDAVMWEGLRLTRVRTASVTSNGNTVVADTCEVALPA